jgi:hypothetical protein
MEHIIHHGRRALERPVYLREIGVDGLRGNSSPADRAGCVDRKFELFKTSNPTERSNQRSAIDSHPASVMAGAI